jgi:hypothetical protein
MAIDSALKRKSISGVLLPFMLVGVTPDAAEPIEWRQSAGWSYSGIAAGAPSIPDVIGPPVYVTGSLTPTMYLTGSLEPSIAMTGSLTPTISLTGTF